MRISEIIRQILDVIDRAEASDAGSASTHVDHDHYDDQKRRFKQIVDLQDQGQSAEYSNSPREEYADIAAVTTAAGGGAQIPKHPADIRGEHPSLYPGKVYGTK